MTAQVSIIDDRLLLESLLAGDQAQGVADGDRTYTTGLWYHRLARAIADHTVTGSLSRLLSDGAEAGAVNGVDVATALTRLPDDIGLISLRDLGWPMAELVADGMRLNLLSLEALAAAIHLEAEICLSVRGQNPPLEAAAAERGVPIRLVAR